MKVRVGTSGYSYKEWKGSFYPEDLPASRVQGLAWLLLECMADPDSDLDDAATSGFLENVAAERFHDDFERYLIGRPLEFYAQWSQGF